MDFSIKTDQIAWPVASAVAAAFALTSPELTICTLVPMSIFADGCLTMPDRGNEVRSFANWAMSDVNCPRNGKVVAELSPLSLYHSGVESPAVAVKLTPLPSMWAPAAIVIVASCLLKAWMIVVTWLQMLSGRLSIVLVAVKSIFPVVTIREPAPTVIFGASNVTFLPANPSSVAPAATVISVSS